MSQQTSPPSTPAAGQAAKDDAAATQPPATPAASEAARDALAKGRAQVATYNPTGDDWMQSADHFQERIKEEAGRDFARVVQLGEHSEKARQLSIAKAEKEGVELEWKKKRLELEEQRAKLRSLKAERDDKDRQRQEDIRRKIAVGDKMMEEGYKLYDQRLRRRKVTDTIDLLHQLGRAKAKRYTEIISDLEQEVAGVDAEILTEARTELEKREMRVLMRREGVSTAKAADPQDSEDSQHSGNEVDLTTTSPDS